MNLPQWFKSRQSTLWHALLLWCVLVMVSSDPAWASEPAQVDDNNIRRYVVDKAFDDVIFELNFAISERNFRITGRNTIGKGLRDRGYSDFPNVEVIHFCSLELAREVLELDLGFVAQMPCRITVHEQEDQTVISVILLPTGHPDPRVVAFARRMNKTLTEIAEFAADTGD